MIKKKSKKENPVYNPPPPQIRIYVQIVDEQYGKSFTSNKNMVPYIVHEKLKEGFMVDNFLGAACKEVSQAYKDWLISNAPRKPK